MESKRYDELVPAPQGTTWPPVWLSASTRTAPAPSTPARREDELAPSGRLPAVSLLDLPPDLFESWQERACIMHYDGRLPWKEAEAAALADVLSRSERLAKATTWPAPQASETPTVTAQATLFPAVAGPYV